MQFSDDVMALNGLSAKDAKNLKPPDDKNFEQEFYDAIAREGDIPLPLRQVKFAKVLGLDYQADFAWTEERLIVEINGGTWAYRGKKKQPMGHGSGYGLLRDYYKLSLATMLDWRLVYFPTEWVADGRAVIITRVLLGLDEPIKYGWKDLQPGPKRGRDGRR